MSIEKLAVIGGGAWGTALAQVAATGGRETLLWALEDEVVAAVNRIHENPVYLKGLKLDPAIRATSNFSDLAEVRRLAGGHPGPAYARRARPLALPEHAADPLLEGHRGEQRQAASRRGARSLPDIAGRGAVGPDLRP